MTDQTNDPRNDFDAYTHYLRADAAYRMGLTDASEDETNRLGKERDAALQAFLFTPTLSSELLEKKFQLFEEDCLNLDGRSYSDNRELKLFGCLKADAISAADNVVRTCR